MKNFMKYLKSQLSPLFGGFLVLWFAIAIVNLFLGNLGNSIGVAAVGVAVVLFFVVASYFTYKEDKKQ